MKWLKNLFRRPAPADAAQAVEAALGELVNLRAATLDELVTENQRLGAEQDAIRARRVELRAEIDRRLAVEG